MLRTPRPALLLPILLVTLASCQVIGGLDELRLGSGGSSAGIGGAGGDASSSSSSTGTVGVGGSGGGPPTTALWSKRFGDNTTQNVTDIAVDAAGNIFIVGDFLGTLDFDSISLVTAGDHDAFLAKLDPDGNTLWAIRFGGTGPEHIESVSLTAMGDPVVGGSHGSAFSIGGTNIGHNGGSDGFVMRFSSADGSLVWRQRFGDAQNQRCGSVSVATDTDDVFCFGDFSGSFSLGGQMFTSAGFQDLIAIRYASDGAFFAAVRSGDAETQMARSIAVNGSGIAYAAARFDGKLDWGSLTSAGDGDVFLGKFQSAGAVAWALRMGDSNTQQPNGLTLVNDDGIVLVGEFEGATDFGGKAISSKGGFDAFIARVDAAGAVSWIRTLGDAGMGTPDHQQATDVVATSDGSLFVTGYAAGTVNFGNDLIAGPGDTDFFVMRLDSMGQTVWSFRSGSNNSQVGRAIAASGTDELVVAGEFRNTLDLGNGPLTSAGSDDIFIAKLKR